jgi:hypothetical protein
MALDENLSPEQVKELADELSVLSKRQSVALQGAAYQQMSREEAAEYDVRRVRIGEICALLGKFRPSRTGR